MTILFSSIKLIDYFCICIRHKLIILFVKNVQIYFLMYIYCTICLSVCPSVCQQCDECFRYLCCHAQHI